jgi:DnaJ family protein C protein 7
MAAGEEMETESPEIEIVDVEKDAKASAENRKEEGNQLYKAKKYLEALAKYSAAIELCPENPAFYGNRSACHMMLSQYNKALEDAKTAVRIDSNFVKGFVRISKCCVALGDTTSAKQAIDQGLTLEPDSKAFDTEIQNYQFLEKQHSDIDTAFELKDYRKALFHVDQSLNIGVASKRLKVKKAECLAYLGRYAEAQNMANDLLRSDSMNADAMYVRGLCLYYEDFVDKAFTHFQQVLRLAPDHQRAKATYKRAKSLKQKKEEGNAAFKACNWSSAHELYTQALEIDPCNKATNAKLYFNRATVAAKLKKFAESVSDCDEALKLDKDYLKAFLRRGRSYMEMEKYDEAIRDFEQINKMERGNHEYRQLLATAKLELKKSKRKDYYKILGVERSANEEEIKKGYRKRALVHHPDRHAGASEEEKKEHEKKFKEVGEAYGVLSDTKKRTRYDQGHDVDDLEGHGHGGFGADIDPNQIFQAFFGGAGGGGHQHHQQHQSFHFGGGGGGQMPGGGQFFQFG